MRLRDVLAPERVVVPLEARTLTEAADVLLGRLGAAHGVLDLPKLRRRIAERRAEDAVGMGDRAFLLHYRTDAVGQLVVALGVSRAIICRQSVEEGEQCARIVLMIAAPPRHAARYLQVVGGFARLLRKADVLAAVLAANDAEALSALDSFAEYKLPEQLTVRDVMSDQPRTIEPDAPLKEAARTLVRTGLGALPVVDEERRVIGMVSE
ncbi:MAG: CBS domain-containing protein, partial [Gemmatimonadota bacterium]|nr:CBS domain-containing protein [Gemmatimonadota bacterium]